MKPVEQPPRKLGQNIATEPSQYGWICPKCERVYSPFQAVCWDTHLTTGSSTIQRASDVFDCHETGLHNCLFSGGAVVRHRSVTS